MRDPWVEASGRGIDFRAVGQEPGWYLEIDNEHVMHLVYDYAERTATTPVPAPVVSSEGVSYTAVTDAHRLAVVIEPRPCSDAMSGQPFPSTVTVTIDGRTLRGCGRSLTALDSPATGNARPLRTPPRK
jgi:putative lipoprotein